MTQIKLIITKLKYHWSDGIFFFLWVSLLPIFIYNLYTNLRENGFDIASCSFFVYLLVAVSYIYTNWQKFNKVQNKELVEIISEYPFFSKQWFSIEFPALLVVTVIYTPIVVLFLIVFTNGQSRLRRCTAE